MSNYTLYLGDCLEVMPGIPAGSVDAIIADWPYGQTNCPWDSIIPLEPLWKECKRVIKPGGAIVLTCRQPFTSALVMSNPKWLKWEDIWHKSQATGHLNCKVMPMREHENILVFGKGRVTYNPQIERKAAGNIRPPRRGPRGSSNYGSYRDIAEATIPADMSYPRSVIKFNTPNHGERGLHPTQKPVALMEYLIKTYTNPGDLVLDNTFGSCSTGEACLNTGRRFIGIEKDPDYFRIGQERMERVERELRGEQLTIAGFR